MSWITGTAGWLYRAITEYIIGVKASFVGLKLQPCFPKEWEKVRVKRLFRDNEYDIEFIKSDKNEIVFDGKTILGNVLPICEKGSKHKVSVLFTKA